MSCRVKALCARALCGLVVSFFPCTSAWASASLNFAGTLWRPDFPGAPTPPGGGFYGSSTYDTSLPSDIGAGSTPIGAQPITGGMFGTVVTTIYRDADNHLIFDYTITRTGGSASIVAASLHGAGWQSVQITSAGVDGPLPAGSSHVGDAANPAYGWTDGTPYQLARDPSLGTPQIVFRTTGITSWAPPATPTFGLVGTVIGSNDMTANIWFRTDATEWEDAPMGVLSGSGEVGTADVLVPLPDPASLALMGLGSGLLLVRRRNRRAVSAL